MGQEVNRAKNSESRGHPSREEWYVPEENIQDKIEGVLWGWQVALEQMMMKAWWEKRQAKVPGFMMDNAEIQCCAGSDSILEAVPVTLNWGYVYMEFCHKEGHKKSVETFRAYRFHLKISEGELFYVRTNTNT